MGIAVLLADDHRIIRQGLRALLEKEPDLEVVAEAENGRKTVQLTRELLPQVVIMDVAMPELNGIEATRQILAELTGVKVIALSMLADRQSVVDMLKMGASGYLLKDCAFEELVGAIRLAMKDKTYLSPAVAGMIIRDYLHMLSLNGSLKFSVLTAREREVLQLLTEGKTTHQIADRLHVSVKTIESHRQQIMNKLNLYSIAELTKFAIREGLTFL